MANIKTNLEKNMNELFDIVPDDIPDNTKVTESHQSMVPLEDDFSKSRKGLESLLATGQEALQYALSVAKQTDDPKAYDVVSGMIKNLANINEQLLELHLKHQRHGLNAAHAKKELKTIQIDPDLPQITNNAIFVGTTSELAKMLKINSGEPDHVITSQ